MPLQVVLPFGGEKHEVHSLQNVEEAHLVCLLLSGGNRRAVGVVALACTNLRPLQAPGYSTSCAHAERRHTTPYSSSTCTPFVVVGATPGLHPASQQGTARWGGLPVGCPACSLARSLAPRPSACPPCPTAFPPACPQHACLPAPGLSCPQHTATAAPLPDVCSSSPPASPFASFSQLVWQLQTCVLHIPEVRQGEPRQQASSTVVSAIMGVALADKEAVVHMECCNLIYLACAPPPIAFPVCSTLQPTPLSSQPCC